MSTARPPLLADHPVASSPLCLSTSPETVPTEGGRDVFVDLVRAVAILAVALGHWLVVVPSYRDGRFDGMNALGTVPLMRQLTWLFQVMPLFFIVGGYANAISWRSAVRRGEGWATWVRTRLVRLVRPTAVFFAVWTGVGLALRGAGVDPALVHALAWLVVVPVWFLAVYVVVVALAPAMLAAHQRWGVGVPVALVAAATVVDVARMGMRVDGVEYTSFFWVFLFAQQLGFFWLDGRLDRRRWVPWCLVVGGLTSLWVLTHVGPYPTSLVGVPGERVANNAPPTITLIALGLAQAGLALVVRPHLGGWLARRRVHTVVFAVNARAMTILLWHFTALVLVALVVLPRGVVPVFPDGSAAWWVIRLGAVLLCAVVLALLVAAFGRYERERRPAVEAGAAPEARRGNRPSGLGPVPPVTLGSGGLLASGRMPAAVAVLAASFSVVTLHGLSIVDRPLGFPLLGAVLFGTGLALVRAD